MAKVLGRPRLSERGEFTVRRRPVKGRLGKRSVAKRHAFKKRTVFTMRLRSHMSGGGVPGVCALRMSPDIFTSLGGGKRCISYSIKRSRPSLCPESVSCGMFCQLLVCFSLTPCAHVRSSRTPVCSSSVLSLHSAVNSEFAVRPKIFPLQRFWHSGPIVPWSRRVMFAATVFNHAARRARKAIVLEMTRLLREPGLSPMRRRRLIVILRCFPSTTTYHNLFRSYGDRFHALHRRLVAAIQGSIRAHACRVKPVPFSSALPLLPSAYSTSLKYVPFASSMSIFLPVRTF